MTDTSLIEAMRDIDRWPVEDQRRLAVAARQIRAQRETGFDLNQEDWIIIDQRAERDNGIASEAETERFFDKYRQA